jgi:hypothetical protein
MKPLNAPDITTAYFRFLGQFLVLMLSIVLIIYAFINAFDAQMQRLRSAQKQYEQVLAMQLQMGETVETIYADLSKLNTGQVGNEQIIEKRVLNQKDELSEALTKKYLGAYPHDAYRRVTGCVNEMLMLKDSIRVAKERLKEVDDQLKACSINVKTKK